MVGQDKAREAAGIVVDLIKGKKMVTLLSILLLLVVLM
jgi:DNA helicase TIP49 (TBP-interacting protein)